MLLDILTAHHETIVERARARVAQRRAPRACEEQLLEGVPLFLRELANMLRGSPRDADRLREAATQHGRELQRAGFSVAQAVHGYGDVCQVVVDVARMTGRPLDATDFGIFNAFLDEAIADALTEYARQRELSLAAEENERVGVFAHEIRNLLNSAMLAYEAIREGHASSTGKTAAILGKNLRAMRGLTDMSLTRVRLDARLHRPSSISIRDLLEELEISATLEAKSRGLELHVTSAPADLCVLGDRALLSSAMANLLQNAMKFTRPCSTVKLHTRSTEALLFLDVQDECGGVPEAKLGRLFQPFEQHGHDTSGVGLGLPISRRAVEANGGELVFRNHPGKGCTFTVVLPRLVAPKSDEAAAAP